MSIAYHHSSLVVQDDSPGAKVGTLTCNMQKGVRSTEAWVPMNPLAPQKNRAKMRDLFREEVLSVQSELCRALQ